MANETQNPNQQSQVLGQEKSAKAGQSSSTEQKSAGQSRPQDARQAGTASTDKTSKNPTDVESDDAE